MTLDPGDHAARATLLAGRCRPRTGCAATTTGCARRVFPRSNLHAPQQTPLRFGLRSRTDRRALGLARCSGANRARRGAGTRSRAGVRHRHRTRRPRTPRPPADVRRARRGVRPRRRARRCSPGRTTGGSALRRRTSGELFAHSSAAATTRRGNGRTKRSISRELRPTSQWVTPRCSMQRGGRRSEWDGRARARHACRAEPGPDGTGAPLPPRRIVESGSTTTLGDSSTEQLRFAPAVSSMAG